MISRTEVSKVEQRCAGLIALVYNDLICIYDNFVFRSLAGAFAVGIIGVFKVHCVGIACTANHGSVRQLCSIVYSNCAAGRSTESQNIFTGDGQGGHASGCIGFGGNVEAFSSAEAEQDWRRSSHRLLSVEWYQQPDSTCTLGGRSRLTVRCKRIAQDVLPVQEGEKGAKNNKKVPYL